MTQALKTKRFSDVVDEMADRLQDAAEDFRDKRAELLGQLEEAKDAYIRELFAAEAWAVEQGLIENDEWTDEQGEPFLPWARTEVITEPVPDLGTSFRERMAELRGKDQT